MMMLYRPYVALCQPVFIQIHNDDDDDKQLVKCLLSIASYIYIILLRIFYVLTMEWTSRQAYMLFMPLYRTNCRPTAVTICLLDSNIH